MTDSSCRILVVDDDDVMRLVTLEHLSNAGFEVAEADNGNDALRHFDDVGADIIVLDVNMPGLDGYETCKLIRQHPRGSSTPILMVTGQDDDESIERAYAAGATDFSTKSIRWSLLHHRLRYMLRNSATVSLLNKSQFSLANAQRVAKIGSWESE